MFLQRRRVFRSVKDDDDHVALEARPGDSTWDVTEADSSSVPSSVRSVPGAFSKGLCVCATGVRSLYQVPLAGEAPDLQNRLDSSRQHSKKVLKTSLGDFGPFCHESIK